MLRHYSRGEYKRIKLIRRNFLVYAALLLVYLVNLLFVQAKILIPYEMIVAGIAYVVSIGTIAKNLELVHHREVLFYVVAHILVLLLILFMFMGDSLSTSGMSYTPAED